MYKTLGLLGAAGIGAGLTFFLDPRLGRRRRALVRDKAARLAHVTSDAADTTSRDLGNRARGLVAELRSRARREDVSDEVVVERVRARIGTAVRHPGSIDVSAQNGRVVLSGPVLADEVARLLRRAAGVRGVRAVENRLEVHETPEGVPGLQGEPSPRFGAWEFAWMQNNWSPTARLMAGAAGGGLALAGLARIGVIGFAMILCGATLLARAITNQELRELVGRARSLAEEAKAGAA
jgi:hypothetical protein